MQSGSGGSGTVFGLAGVAGLRRCQKRGCLLGDDRRDLAVVSADVEVERAGVEPVDGTEDGDLLELQRAVDLGLPLRIGEVVDGGGWR